ncbi:MAG: TlpA family protein disulfide reductase [Deltaproteobacteria bacterium]|nr:TlpA family protein disulfide reductase [Deltaproteobacteria bacterium]
MRRVALIVSLLVVCWPWAGARADDGQGPARGHADAAKSVETTLSANGSPSASGSPSEARSPSMKESPPKNRSSAAKGLRTSQAATTLQRLVVGQRAPIFSLRTLNAKLSGRSVFALRDHVGDQAPPNGQGVLLSFAASFCEPCRQELAALRDLAPRLAAAGISVAVVVTDTDPEGLAIMEQLTVHELKLPFPVLSDRFGVVGRRYGVSALPMTVVIDRKGAVRWQSIGYQKEALDALKDALGLVDSELQGSALRSKEQRIP